MDDRLDDELPRRRQADIPASSWELVLYQLSELKAAVREGFQRMEGRFDAAEERISSLERFRERVEERDRAQAEASNAVNSRWVPIALGVFAAVVTIILFLIGAR